MPSPLFLSTSGVAVAHADDDVEVAVHLDVGGPGARGIHRERAASAAEARAVSSVNAPSAAWMNRRTPAGPAATRSILKSWFQSSASEARDGPPRLAGNGGDAAAGVQRDAPVEASAAKGPDAARRRAKTPPARRATVGASPMTSGVNVSASSAADGVATGVAKSQERRERLGDELGRRGHEPTALAERGYARKDIAKKRDRARRVGHVRGAERLLQGPVPLDDFRRPGADELLEPADGVRQHRRVAALGGQPRALDEHCRILGLKRDQLLEQALRLGVGIGPAGVLDLLNERRARVETSRIELDGAAQLRDRLVAPSARRFEPAHQKRDLARRRAPAPPRVRAPGRGVEVAEPQVRQPRLAHEAGSPGASSVACVNSCLAASIRPTCRPPGRG